VPPTFILPKDGGGVPATIFWTKEIPVMLKLSVKTRDRLRRLRTNKDGVASFEYVIVAACVIAAATAVFGGAGAGTIQGALTTGIGVIMTTIAGA
jgi:pilus assembly protein Flp/PilA